MKIYIEIEYFSRYWKLADQKASGSERENEGKSEMRRHKLSMSFTSQMSENKTKTHIGTFAELCWLLMTRRCLGDCSRFSYTFLATEKAEVIGAIYSRPWCRSCASARVVNDIQPTLKMWLLTLTCWSAGSGSILPRLSVTSTNRENKFGVCSSGTACSCKK